MNKINYKIPEDIYLPETEEEHEKLLTLFRQLRRDGASKQNHPNHREYEVVKVLLTEFDRQYIEKYDIPDESDGIDALELLMDAQGMKQKDLLELDAFNSKQVVSDIMNRRRGLTVHQVKALAERFGVNAGVFI